MKQTTNDTQSQSPNAPNRADTPLREAQGASAASKHRAAPSTGLRRARRTKTPRAKAQKRAVKVPSLALAVLSIVFAVVLGVGAAYVFQFASSAAAAKRIAQTEEAALFVPVRFTVYGKGIDTVSARVALFDAHNHEIAVIERSWNGVELYLDFVSAEFAGFAALFPLRLYTDTTAGAGVELKRYYYDGDVCRIFCSAGDEAKTQKDFERLFHFAHSAYKLPFFAPYAKKYTVRLTAFDSAKECSVYTSLKGTLRAVQE